jgi:hypothetical protein
LHAGYIHAFTNALSSVFLVATGVAAAGFVMSWFIRQLPLRETVATGDLRDTYAVPRDTDSDTEMLEKLGRLDRHEPAPEVVGRVAAGAGVELSPAACWMLATLSEDGSSYLPALASRSRVSLDMLTGVRLELTALGLACTPSGATSLYALTPDGRSALERLTGECERRLRELLDGWRADNHSELQRLIAVLSRELLSDSSSLRVVVRLGDGRAPSA